LENFGPEESRNLGINIIFQDHVLIPAFTGIENICLGRPYPVKNGLIRWSEMEREAKAKAEELGIRLDLRKPVSELGPSQKKCVEIIRAMMNDCRLLILDEPTASLSDKETSLLFEIVRRLKEKGTAVLYVTHRLEEILELTDRVTVLRNGELVTTVETGQTTKQELVRLMSGNDAEAGSEHPAAAGKKAGTESGADLFHGRFHGKTAIDCHHSALAAQDIYSRDGIVRGASLTAENGRVTGLFGLCGSGRTELLECIYGYRKIKSGAVYTNGSRMERLGAPEAIRRGMAFICEDRRGKAMIPSFTVLDNMMLSSIDRYSGKGRFLHKKADGKAKEMIDALKIKCIGTEQPTCELSGGNQQKVVFAKALLTEPTIWLCDEPTQAVDVSTRHEIHRLLRAEADSGKAVIYVSSDLAEILEVADEIAVMAAGKIVKKFENSGLTQEMILACCYEAEREESLA
jgi:ABC-type sugar transport system ATPase subunit